MVNQIRRRLAIFVVIGIIAALTVMITIGILSRQGHAGEPYGLAAMSSFERLPYLQPYTLAGGASSYDRSEGNFDGFGESNFLYLDKHGDKVMLDLKGPGTIYRMWFTGFNPVDATIKIYFDGEVDPRVDMPLRDLLSGTNEPFLSPLVVDDTASSGGFVCYLPLPFSESVKVTTNGIGDSFFYNIGYHTYTPDTAVMTWDGKEDSAEVNGIWSAAGKNPFSEDGTTAETGSIDIDGGKEQVLLRIEGQRAISSLKLNIPGVTPATGNGAVLNEIRLRLYWDGEETPAVDAPLGSFFALGPFGAFGTKALPVGMDDTGTMYAYFPMPFEKEARLELVNTGTESVKDVSFELRHRPFSGSFRQMGYFKTRFSEQQAEAYDGKDLPVLEEEGAGKFIGVVQSLNSELNQGPVDRWHLEGDEKVYVDGSQSPAIHGTGTEDFYNGGWYFNKGLFTQPLAGYTAFRIENNRDSATMYRFLTHDAIPFRDGIRVMLEHGAFNDVTEQVWLLAFYYHNPRSQLVLSDTLDVGNEESEQSHAYEITETYWQGSSLYQYEGAQNNDLVTDNGRAHTGYSSFTLDLQPGNEGALLRRRFDQTVENQSASVYVDNDFVGIWYKAGGNGTHNWRDEDFIIPASYTRGKRSIRLKVEYIDSAVAWNEYRYSLFSLIP
ncbi:glycoside hydrolase family 172 protein [Paenibacillus sp. LPE1-1-1.1]|uniref:glycoside hydrolase family 172 protein n=1 Tax=Paenibacillus sp. LPE1-1-1.1 TaxID=3135230 RepID=UPI00342D4E0A